MNDPYADCARKIFELQPKRKIWSWSLLFRYLFVFGLITLVVMIAINHH